jgi:hypothetical protein
VRTADTPTSATTEISDIVWGGAAIGAVIGRNERQTLYLLERNAVACARKVRGQWVASKSSLRREFGGAE